MFIGANKCSRCGGSDANCNVCRDIPEEKPKAKPRMDTLIKNSLDILRTDARILDAKIDLAEKYFLEIDKIHQASADEMASLRAQKKALEATAKSITEQL